MDLGLQGRIALVTGGSRGIGRAIALRLAEEGCNVGICARDQDHLSETLEAISSLDVKAFALSADVTKPDEIDGFVKGSSTVLGPPSILICNVGVSAEAEHFEDVTDSQWLNTVDLNVLHCARSIRAVLPAMKVQESGSILIVSSISGWKPTRNRAAYASAKAALIHLAASLSQELATYGVRVNAISPGSTLYEGGGWDKFRATKPGVFERFERSQFPYGRLASADEIADVAVFLVSDRARWINGANIPVDGGQREPSVSTESY